MKLADFGLARPVYEDGADGLTGTNVSWALPPAWPRSSTTGHPITAWIFSPCESCTAKAAPSATWNCRNDPRIAKRTGDRYASSTARRGSFPVRGPSAMKILLASCAALAVLTLTAPADEIRRIGLDGSGPIEAPVQEDGKDGIARIHKVAQASLEVFPAKQKPSHGTVVICPGGGYGILAVTHEGRDVAKMLNDDGWDAAVLLYHVSEGTPTRDMALADAKGALALVQKRGAEFGLSAENVGVMGFSAGGHLAARVAHETAESNPPKFLVLLYPAYLEKDGKVLEEVSPTKAPVFLYVAADDRYSTSAVAFAAALKEKGIRVDFTEPEHGGHGFGLKKDLPAAVRDWPDKLKAFLATVEPGK